MYRRCCSYTVSTRHKFRRRYWEFVSDSMQLNRQWIDEVLKIREPLAPAPDMDAVDAVFIALLQNTRGEVRNTILNHATRLYFRAAADCPNIVSRWSNLNRKFGSDFAFGIKLKLWVMQMLRVRPDGVFFNWLKKFHVFLAR